MDFVTGLAELAGGKAMIVAGVKLSELIEAVKGTGKKGFVDQVAAGGVSVFNGTL